MARPRTLSDEERKESNARRQREWRRRHLGLARLKVRNAHARRKAKRHPKVEEPVQKPAIEPAIAIDDHDESDTFDEPQHVPMYEVELDAATRAEYAARQQRRSQPRKPITPVTPKPKPPAEVEQHQTADDRRNRFDELKRRIK